MSAEVAGEYLAWAAVVIGTATSIPQLVHSYSSRRVNDLSLMSLLMGLLSSVLWIVYGALNVAERLQVTVSSAIRIGLSLALIVCYLLYVQPEPSATEDTRPDGKPIEMRFTHRYGRLGR